MLAVEFQKFVEYFCASFPDFSHWLTTDAKSEMLLDAWRRAFASMPFTDAVAGVAALLASEDQPTRISSFPGAIRRLALAGNKTGSGPGTKFGPELIETPGGPELAAECWQCMDYGIIEVWHPDAVAAVRSGRFNGRRLLCVVRCTCGRGNHDSRRWRNDGRGGRCENHPRFDPAQWLPFDFAESDATNAEQLRAWVANGCRQPVAAGGNHGRSDLPVGDR